MAKDWKKNGRAFIEGEAEKNTLRVGFRVPMIRRTSMIPTTVVR